MIFLASISLKYLPKFTAVGQDNIKFRDSCVFLNEVTFTAFLTLQFFSAKVPRGLKSLVYNSNSCKQLLLPPEREYKRNVLKDLLGKWKKTSDKITNIPRSIIMMKNLIKIFLLLVIINFTNSIQNTSDQYYK